MVNKYVLQLCRDNVLTYDNFCGVGTENNGMDGHLYVYREHCCHRCHLWNLEHYQGNSILYIPDGREIPMF